MLTRKQHELLLFVDGHLKRTGFSPSFEEMKEALGLRSKSGIHRLISALEERGFLERRRHRARALEVLRLPETPLAETPLAEAAEVAPIALVARLELPLYGRIAAGAPIEAIVGDEEIVVPPDMVGAGAHYALEVAGDSMVEAGILDGDRVVIQECERAADGEIVVALVDGAEATLKRLRLRGSMVALEPANPAYQTRLLPAGRVRIQGRLVGLLRRY